MVRQKKNRIDFLRISYIFQAWDIPGTSRYGDGSCAGSVEKVFYYKPLVSEIEYNEYTTPSLIDRLYAGSAKNLAGSLLGSQKLDDAD